MFPLKGREVYLQNPEPNTSVWFKQKYFYLKISLKVGLSWCEVQDEVLHSMKHVLISGLGMQSCSCWCHWGSGPLDLHKMKLGSRLCTLNVGGRRFSFPVELMKRLPLSRLSRLHSCLSESELLELCDDYDRDRNEFFFDRHSDAFSFIMLYVQHGKLRFVPHMCELSFYNEMLYWGLESSDLQLCCQRRLDQRMSDCFVHFFPEEEPQGPEEPRSHWLERMRRTFEEPTSSLAAQILASVSVLFVVISIVMLFASTLPSWKAAETLDQHQ